MMINVDLLPVQDIETSNVDQFSIDDDLAFSATNMPYNARRGIEFTLHNGLEGETRAEVKFVVPWEGVSMLADYLRAALRHKQYV